MDSEHRHELEENDLAEALSDWRELWAKYGTFVTLVLLVVVVGFAAVRISGYFARTTHESAWSEYMQTSTPEGLADVADSHGVEPVKLLALLRGADLYLHEAVFPPELNEAATPAEGDAPTGGSVALEDLDPAQRDQRLDRAEAMYRRVLDRAEAAEFRVNALLGLAAVAESREQWQDAESFYDRARDEAAGSATPLPELVSIAGHRRGLLERLREPVAIVDPPPLPEAEPAAQQTPGDFEVLPGIDVSDLLEIDPMSDLGGTLDAAPVDTAPDAGPDAPAGP